MQVMVEPRNIIKKGCMEMNVFEQKHKFVQRDERPRPNVSPEEMAAAFECAEDESLKCDCWNTGCRYFDKCRECIAFHTYLKHVPTCQRELMEEIFIEGDYPGNVCACRVPERYHDLKKPAE